MKPEAALQHRARVEEFRRKHRIGLLTLVFTDLVGSTRLKQELGDEKAVMLLQRHHALLRQILAGFKEAEEIETAGDSFFLVFAKPSDAVRFSLILQNRLRNWIPEVAHPIVDRIGIHIGEVVIEERTDSPKPKDLYGLQVDISARVMSLANGDQILMTRSVFDNARQVLKGQEIEDINELSWFNHGPYFLKGVDEPLEICEVGETNAAILKPPPDSEKVRRHISADSEPVLGWRPAIGQVVPGSEWALVEKLGEGGFGEVWLGLHPKLKEKRVFKFCFRADRVRSLKRELTIFRLLKDRLGQHPNIAALHDVYLNEPPFYLTTEYAHGRDLPSWIDAQGGFDHVPLAVRIDLVAQIADALHAAHQAGVVHRDIKPSNIVISQDVAPNSRPIAKLTDFGIGQVVSEEALAGITRLGFTQTLASSEASALAGTQMYLAPELTAGKPASIQSDVYSLGVVLFQLLCGDFSRPVTMDWPREIEEPILVNQLATCFAGDPQERFATAQRFGENLRSFKRKATFLAAWRTFSRQFGTVGYRIILVLGACMMLWGMTGLCLLLTMAALSWFGFQPRFLASDPARFLMADSRLLFTSTWIGVFACYAARVRYQGGWPTAVGILFCMAGWFLLFIVKELNRNALIPLLAVFILGFGLLSSGHKQHLRQMKFRKPVSPRKGAQKLFSRFWAPGMLATSLLAFVAYSFQPSRPAFSLLYRLDSSESTPVVQELDRMNIPHQVSEVNPGEASIYVPQNMVHLIRMQLASKSLPTGKARSFSLFEKPAFGMVDFVQEANYLRAVQDETARTIGQIDGVRLARVMIVAPESRGLTHSRRLTASVFVTLHENVQLSVRAIHDIRFLLAHAVEGLETNNVSVVDQLGNLLSQPAPAPSQPNPPASPFTLINLAAIANAELDHLEMPPSGPVQFEEVPFEFSVPHRVFRTEGFQVTAPTSVTFNTQVPQPLAVYILISGNHLHPTHHRKQAGLITLGFADKSELQVPITIGVTLRESWAYNTEIIQPGSDEKATLLNVFSENQQRGDKPVTAFLDMLVIHLRDSKAMTALSSITIRDTSRETLADIAPSFIVSGITVQQD